MHHEQDNPPARRPHSRRAFIAGAATSLAWVGVSGLALPFRASPEPGLEVRSLALTDGVQAFRADGTTPVTVGAGWSTNVALPLAGPMVALGWDGASDAAMRIRSHGPDGWSSWMHIAASPDEAPDPDSGEGNGRAGIGPVWVGDGTDRVELRLDRGELHALRLDAMRPTGDDSGAGRFGISGAAAAPGTPAIIRRSQWGAGPWASSNGNCGPSPRHADRLQRAIVHHTVNTNTYSATEARALLRGIYHYHVNGRGWCDVAYNYFIDRFGNVYEGRMGSLDGPVIGGHAAGFNTGSVGIALLGQYHPGASPSAARVSAPQQEALRRLLAWIFGEYGLDAGAITTAESLGSNMYPRGTRVSMSTIIGHRDTGVTSCPGSHAYAHLPSLRDSVQSAVVRGIPYPLPKWQPDRDQPALLSLDAYGGLHPAGGQGVLHPRPRGYWSGWEVARSAVRMDVGGYVLDAYGGLHGFGRAPNVRSSWYHAGMDTCVDVARGPDDTSGWVLDVFGNLHPFGNAESMSVADTFPGRLAGRALDTNRAGTGGYVLDAFGALHPFGNALLPTGAGTRWPRWDMARDLALRPDGQSGWILDAWGGIHSFGGAPRHRAAHYTRDRDTARSIVSNDEGTGGWVLDRDGHILPFGDAQPVYAPSTWAGVGIGKKLLLRR